MRCNRGTRMPFCLRLQFPGAICHVINRGNYRSWIFAGPRTKAAFEACLFEACVRHAWILHAFATMSNHFHLALETPLGNLASGMQWLESTFANRFNRLRNERGHLFQSRYKALVVEPGDALGHVCHYIHLNPVRAGMCAVVDLAAHRHTSYWYLLRPKQRPPFLRLGAALSAVGEFPDTRPGWDAYADYLAWQAEEGPAGKNPSYVSMSRGWAIGSDDFKRSLLVDPLAMKESEAWNEHGPEEARYLRWQLALDRALTLVPFDRRQPAHQSANWKRAIAAHLRATTDVSNGWLADRLQMGSAAYVSKHIGLTQRSPHPDALAILDRLKRVKGEA